MISQKILVTGVFDLLHQEHINFLRKAKLLGGKLVVGVESDKRVRELKGATRPIQSAQKRVMELKKLGLANEVFILPEEFSRQDQHLELLKKINPQVLAVSSHTPNIEQKRLLMSKVGGRVVVVHQHNPKISTTKKLSEVNYG